MKKLIFAAVIMFGVVSYTFYGCRKDNDPSTPGMTLVSLTSGPTSLLLKQFDTVRNISTSYNIIATFSNNIDYFSIRDTTIILRRDTLLYKLNFVVSGKTLTIDPGTELLAGTNFLLELTDIIRSTNGDHFEGVAINIETEGLGVDTPPKAGDQIMYLAFNGSIADITLHDTVVSQSLTYSVDRFGIAARAGSFAGVTGTSGGTGKIVELGGDTLVTPSMTFSMWINIANLSYRFLANERTGVFGLAGEIGYFLDIKRQYGAGPVGITWGTTHAKTDGGYFLAENLFMASDTSEFDSVKYLLRDGWHHLALTYDNATSTKAVYIDGTPRAQWILDANNGMAVRPTTDTAYFAVGYYDDKKFTKSPRFIYQSATNTFTGDLDDFRVYKVALRPDEIMRLFNKEELK